MNEIKTADPDNVDIEVLVFPSARAAYNGVDHVLKVSKAKGGGDEVLAGQAKVVRFVVRDVSSPEDALPELHALVVPTEIYAAAFSFWRWAGFGLSTRHTVMILNRLCGGAWLEMTPPTARDSPCWLVSLFFHVHKCEPY